MLNRTFGLYAILTNPNISYEALAQILVEESVQVIQLRVKDKPQHEIKKIAQSIRRITQGTSTLFIINDDPYLTVDVDADGIHIGQSDQSYEDVRKIVGNKFIGLSTHNLSQVKGANLLALDYIGVGPVYATPTKVVPDPVLGLDTMEAMVNLSKVPAVAIGGIDLDRLDDVLKSGAKNICAVRAINQAVDHRAVIKEIQRKLKLSHSIS
jgi:thiamine-phosphate pyrophosphorylase